MRNVVRLAGGITVLLLLTSCAPYDGVLAGQLFVFKDPFVSSLSAIKTTDPVHFADEIRSNTSNIPATYWDGNTDPGSLHAAQGGVVIWM